VDQGDAVQPPGPQSAARRGHLGADSLADLLVAQIGPVKEFQDLDLIFREPVNETREAIPLAEYGVEAGRRRVLRPDRGNGRTQAAGHLLGQGEVDFISRHIGDAHRGFSPGEQENELTPIIHVRGARKLTDTNYSRDSNYSLNECVPPS
jgi:hypothetical protein